MSREVRRWLARPGLTVGVAYVAAFSWVYTVSRDDQQRKVDAIVVLGAAQSNGHPSPVLRARVDHALALYQRRLAPRIVLTGGIHPGDNKSEAEVERRYLADAGVPADSLISLPNRGLYQPGTPKPDQPRGAGRNRIFGPGGGQNSGRLAPNYYEYSIGLLC